MTTTDEVKARLGQLILETYRAKGLTRMDVAKALDLSTRAITSMTQGDSLPRVSNREPLEKILGWRPDSIQEFLVEANSGTPLESLTVKWMAPRAEGGKYADSSPEDLADELLRRLRNAESRVRSLQRELESVKEEVLSQPDYSLAAHRAEPSMIARWRAEAEQEGQEPA